MTSAEGGSAGTPANSGNEGGVQATLFTQDQVNTIAAKEKRGALGAFFKELGFDNIPDAETVKSTFDAAKEFKKRQDGEKGDVERLGGELAAANEKANKVPALETTILQQRIAGEQQLPVRFWRFVEGKTEDEIKDSITELKKELNLSEGGDGNDGGGGDDEKKSQQQQQQKRPPAPNPQQGATSGGGSPGKTLASGAEAYKAKHGKNKE